MTTTSRDIGQRVSPCLEWLFAEPEAIEDRVAAAAKQHLRQVEFWYWRRRDVDHLAKALHDNGVGVSAVVVDPQANIADRTTHDPWLANVRDSAEVAAHLHSPILVATAGQRVEAASEDEQLRAVTDAFTAAAAIAADHNVTLALEPLNDRVDHRGTLLTSSFAALDLVEEVGSPALGILLDVYHSHAMGEDVPAVIRRLGPHIAHIQVADDPGRHEPGTGTVPWAAVLTALDDVGYQGSIGLEYKPTMPSADSVTFSLRALRD
ncbi:MAG TPA: TIM barrel protein [Acidimicrobiales bacterium]|nr:TIM barrel protein [Acidimicrobiales bacterium]